MSRSHIACWALLVLASALLASCGTDAADTKTASGNRPVVVPQPAHEDSVRPAEGDLAAYAQTIEGLEDFIERGRREVRSMGELPLQAAADPVMYATQIGIWEDTRSEWSDDLVLIEGGLPKKPARQSAFALVHENLGRTIQELRRVPFSPSGGRTPTAEDRQKRLDAAESYLRAAKSRLGNTAG